MTAAISAVMKISPTPMANHAGLEKSVDWPPRRWNARRNPACQQMPHSASSMSAKTTVELVSVRRLCTCVAKSKIPNPNAAVRPVAATSSTTPATRLQSGATGSK